MLRMRPLAFRSVHSGNLIHGARSAFEEKIHLLAARCILAQDPARIFLQFHLAQVSGGLGVVVDGMLLPKFFAARRRLAGVVAILVAHGFERIV